MEKTTLKPMYENTNKLLEINKQMNQTAELNILRSIRERIWMDRMADKEV